MRFIPPRLWALALGSALLQALPFPLAGPVPALRRAVCWFCLVPLLACLLQRVRTLSVKQGTSLGYGCGVLWYLHQLLLDLCHNAPLRRPARTSRGRGSAAVLTLPRSVSRLVRRLPDLLPEQTGQGTRLTGFSFSLDSGRASYAPASPAFPGTCLATRRSITCGLPGWRRLPELSAFRCSSPRSMPFGWRSPLIRIISLAGVSGRVRRSRFYSPQASRS